MIAAFCVSVVFLISYLVYHANSGIVYYQKTGLIRYVYFAILYTHTPLAAAVPVLAIITLRRALKAEKTGDFKPPSADRPLDAAHLAVCERYRCLGLPHAVLRLNAARPKSV